MMMHTFSHFKIMLSTLATFCMYFMSRSVLIRSVHHFGYRSVHPFWPKCLIVLTWNLCAHGTLQCAQCAQCAQMVHSVYSVHKRMQIASKVCKSL